MKPHEKPGTPGDILEHHGIKGMHWGIRRNLEDKAAAKAKAVINDVKKERSGLISKPIAPGTPEFQQVVARVTRTDHPQVLTPGGSGKIKPGEHSNNKQGLTRNEKILIAFGAATAAAAGYYAYKRYLGGKLPGLSAENLVQLERTLGDLKLPAKWDVSGLRKGPISEVPLGQLGRGNLSTEFIKSENLVVNTSRGYADVLPKDGFSNPFAAEQHASATRVLEEMRDKYPSIRNMNIEVVPMSHVPGVEVSNAHMCVMSMRSGEARLMYNDVMEAPSIDMIKANAKFLPGLGHSDYVAYHEMGHLLAVANGDMPPAYDLVTGDAGASVFRTWQKADPLLHRRTFGRHGFSFKELSKLSGYAATEPAEAMAELSGHYHTPSMRGYLTEDQFRRAEAMFNEMGGVTNAS